MDPVPMFLNERSYPVSFDRFQLIACVKSTLAGLRRAKEIAGDIVLGSEVALHNISMTERHETLASILGGGNLDWWRFVRALQQRSPFSEMPGCLPPAIDSHVDPATTAGDRALLWSLQNDAFVISFPSASEWRSNTIDFGMCTCSDGVHTASSESQVRQISNPQDADHWYTELETYAHTEAVSSVVYQDEEVVLKMYLNDHGPPHVHAFLASDPGTCVAKIRFDVGPEITKGRLADHQKNRIFALMRPLQGDLISAWARCSEGRRPLLIGS